MQVCNVQDDQHEVRTKAGSRQVSVVESYHVTNENTKNNLSRYTARYMRRRHSGQAWRGNHERAAIVAVATVAGVTDGEPFAKYARKEKDGTLKHVNSLVLMHDV